LRTIESEFCPIEYNELERKYRFWNLLEPYTSQKILEMKSLTAFFSDDFGEKFFIHSLVSVPKLIVSRF